MKEKPIQYINPKWSLLLLMILWCNMFANYVDDCYLLIKISSKEQ